MKRYLLIMMAALMVLPFSVSAKKKTADIKVISYNIRLGTAKDGDNSWEFRYPASSAMINDQKPDIFGLQEAFDFQKDYLDEACKGYSCVGVGRDDGKAKGEQMAIFYNTKRIKLRKWGTFWLSETPDTPSKGWDAACFRTATWALLKDKKSGKEFYYVNTHLDHVGKEARLKGLALIVDRIKDINPDVSVRAVPEFLTKENAASLLADADVVIRFDSGFYKDRPALVRKQFGDGFAYYMTADCDDGLLRILCDKIIRSKKGIARVKMVPGISVERLADEAAEYLVFQNFTDVEKRLPLDYNKLDILFGYDPVPECGVLVLRVPREKNKGN